MDSYNRGNQDGSQPQKKPGTGPLKAGTGALGDSFQPTGTGPLNKSGTGTRRLASGPLDVERALSGMRAELDNGLTLVAKFEPRMAVLNRGLSIADRPHEATQICAGISPGEAGYTKQVAQILIQDPGIKRRVQVATYQFDQAKRGLQQATDAIQKADLYEGALKAQYVESQIQVEKLRGQLYPLINLHMVFKDNPLLAQLIPAPKTPSGQPDFPPPPPVPPSGAQPSEPAVAASGLAAVLGTGPLSDDPTVQQMVDRLTKVTGSLKDRFSGFLKKKE